MDETKPTENPTASQTPAPQTAAPQPAAAEAPKPAVEEIDIDHFARVKLKVGRVVSAEALPKSKKLLKLQVDMGALGTRQILAGIAQFYTPESMVGKKIIVVSNLKPATLMGQQSQGMLLAASSPDGSMLKVVEPSPDLPEGSEVR